MGAGKDRNTWGVGKWKVIGMMDVRPIVRDTGKATIWRSHCKTGRYRKARRPRIFPCCAQFIGNGLALLTV